jgi:hypothetical protein
MDGFAVGFMPVFSGFAFMGLSIIIILKVVLMVQQIMRQSKTPILPMSQTDIATGATTAIMRSPSDSTLYKRYMTAREPAFVQTPSTPRSQGLKSPFESFRPSSPATVASSEEVLGCHQVQLQLPLEIQPRPQEEA